MKSIDTFLDRMPRKDYNCLNFAAEVWAYLTGEDVSARLDRLLARRHVVASAVKSFEELKKPVSPCLVVMQRSKLVPHIGVYYDERILHLCARGVEFQPPYIAQHYFSSLRFYR